MVPRIVFPSRASWILPRLPGALLRACATNWPTLSSPSCGSTPCPRTRLQVLEWGMLSRQFGPMSHPTTTLLTCPFCQNPDHEQARPSDSVPHVDDDDRESFVSRHRARLNQKAALAWEGEVKPKLCYLSWMNLSLV